MARTAALVGDPPGRNGARRAEDHGFRSRRAEPRVFFGGRAGEHVQGSRRVAAVARIAKRMGPAARRAANVGEYVGHQLTSRGPGFAWGLCLLTGRLPVGWPMA